MIAWIADGSTSPATLAVALALLGAQFAAAEGPQRRIAEATGQARAVAVVADAFQLHKLRRAGARGADADPSPREAANSGWHGDFDARLKWYTTTRWLPPNDAQRRLDGESMPIDHSADLRLMWRRGFGNLRLIADHSTTWLYGDTLDAAGALGLTLDQTPTGDDRRVMRLSWDLDDGDQRLLHRFDRLALEYRANRWGITVGRQAVSWGGGLIFQPMDLFNPFAPTTVDQDYKAGDDLVLIERLFDGGSDLQVLAVGRRSNAGDVTLRASSLAVKFRGLVGDREVELMASRHYDRQVYGIGLRVPVGGALVRSDIIWTRLGGGATVSGLLNVDYSLGVGDAIVHVFGEYFHNGFGASRLPDDLARLPTALTDRIDRGELFNLMRNYLAVGTTFRWHYLFNQSLAVIANLHDASLVVQAHLSYDASDASRLQIGATKPFGGSGDEFGELGLGDGLTVGGGDQVFLRFVYFF